MCSSNLASIPFHSPSNFLPGCLPVSSTLMEMQLVQAFSILSKPDLMTTHSIRMFFFLLSLAKDASLSRTTIVNKHSVWLWSPVRLLRTWASWMKGLPMWEQLLIKTFTIKERLLSLSWSSITLCARKLSRQWECSSWDIWNIRINQLRWTDSETWWMKRFYLELLLTPWMRELSK